MSLETLRHGGCEGADGAPRTIMKATTLLERQHQNLRQLCDAVERGSANARALLLPQLAGELAAHFAVEGQLFYPAVSAALHEDFWMRAGERRHAQALSWLDQALDSPLDGEEFARAMAGLRRAVDVHATEDAQLFDNLERTFDRDALRKLGRSMLSLYPSKVEAGYARHSETLRTAAHEA